MNLRSRQSMPSARFRAPAIPESANTPDAPPPEQFELIAFCEGCGHSAPFDGARIPPGLTIPGLPARLAVGGRARSGSSTRVLAATGVAERMTVPAFGRHPSGNRTPARHVDQRKAVAWLAVPSSHRRCVQRVSSEHSRARRAAWRLIHRGRCGSALLPAHCAGLRPMRVPPTPGLAQALSSVVPTRR